MKFRIAATAVLLMVLLGISSAQDIPPDRLTLAPEVAEGNLAYKVDPAYPQMAKVAHIEGDVVLKALIARNGKIENLRAVSGHPILIQSAMDAVRQWKYKPYTVNGEPVAVQTTITVRYHLPHDSSAAEPAPVQQVIKLSPWELHAKIKHEVLPEYPGQALDNHIQGDITIDVVTDADGNVVSAIWVNDGNSTLLSQPAVDAVIKWKYQPTLLNGNPVAVASWVVIRFRLADKPIVEILTRDESSTPAKKAERLAVPDKLRISSGVAERNLVHEVDPVYPQEAKDAGIEGDVVVQYTIGKDGNIARARVFSGHPMLAEAALEAVKQWRYKPWILNGEPVEVESVVIIKFHR